MWDNTIQYNTIHKFRECSAWDATCIPAHSKAFGVSLTHFYLMSRYHAQGLLSHALAPFEINSFIAHCKTSVFNPGSFPKALLPALGSDRSASLAIYRTRMPIGYSLWKQPISASVRYLSISASLPPLSSRRTDGLQRQSLPGWNFDVSPHNQDGQPR